MKMYNLETKEKDLKPGEIVSGRVKSIQPYGAFIELKNGKTGLVYIEDLSVCRIKSPKERLKIGQNINIMVKSVGIDGKITLSYKEMLGTWEENISNFQVGTKAKGIIRDKEKNKNGIFIELMPNLVGMAEYTEQYNYGEEIEVYIKKIIPEKKKIKLEII